VYRWIFCKTNINTSDGNPPSNKVKYIRIVNHCKSIFSEYIAHNIRGKKSIRLPLIKRLLKTLLSLRALPPLWFSANHMLLSGARVFVLELDI
jgi:hypothetical protein